MIAYVGLDLGVETSVITNSSAPKLHPRICPERKEDSAKQERDMETVRNLSVVLDIRPDDEDVTNS
jgi:hypothetical protein